MAWRSAVRTAGDGELRVARPEVEQDGGQRRARIAQEARARASPSSAASCREIPETPSSRPLRKSAASCLRVGVEPELDARTGTAAGASGDASAPGVARESVAAEADGSGGASSSTTSGSAAGTSDADVSVSSTSANGPDPTGCAAERVLAEQVDRGRRPAGAPARSAASAPGGTRRAASGSEKTTRRGPDEVDASPRSTTSTTGPV